MNTTTDNDTTDNSDPPFDELDSNYPKTTAGDISDFSSELDPSLILHEMGKKLIDKLQPYNFVIKDTAGNPINLDGKNVKNSRIQCPHFSALLDHTIAVLWAIFSKSTKGRSMSPSKILWAQRFLEGIKNKSGDPSKDILEAIRRMQNRIFMKYSNQDDDVPSSVREDLPPSMISFSLIDALGENCHEIIENVNNNTFLVNEVLPAKELDEQFLTENQMDRITDTANEDVINDVTDTSDMVNVKTTTFTIAAATASKDLSRVASHVYMMKEITGNVGPTKVHSRTFVVDHTQQNADQSTDAKTLIMTDAIEGDDNNSIVMRETHVDSTPFSE